MSPRCLLEFDHDGFDAKALDAVLAMVDELTRTLAVARILMERGRSVDLTGFDRGMGLLCAKALDLAPTLGTQLRPALACLLAQVDAFIALLHGAANPPGRRKRA